jgi:tRNA pseudouridine38-40 synthase
MLATFISPDQQKAISPATTTKIALVVEYDGTHYYGFQLQANQPTIQEELEKAIRRLTGEKTRVLAASRTDTGVHARGQIVSFRTGASYSPETFVNGLNYYLPRGIAVKVAYRVRESFNVRRQASSREYSYYILNRSTRSPLWEGRAYWVRESLDIDAMNQACRTLIGEHDFISFTTSLDNRVMKTVRRVFRAEVRRDGELVIFNIVASSFLPHQVRNTVGALIRVGLGKMSIHEFCSIIKAKKPGLAGPTAPADGLYLMQVNFLHPFEEERHENL